MTPLGFGALIFVPQILKGWDVAGRDVDRKGIERVGVGNGHCSMCSRFSLVRRST